jgi:hypothetical protein
MARRRRTHRGPKRLRRRRGGRRGRRGAARGKRGRRVGTSLIANMYPYGMSGV